MDASSIMLHDKILNYSLIAIKETKPRVALPKPAT